MICSTPIFVLLQSYISYVHYSLITLFFAMMQQFQGCSSFHACCSYGAFRSVQKKKTMRSLRHHSVVQFVTAITQDIHMMIVSEIHQQVIYSAMPFSPWETKLPYSSDQQVILSMPLFISTTTKPVSPKQVGVD
jgi:hypothetical protein